MQVVTFSTPDWIEDLIPGTVWASLMRRFHILATVVLITLLSCSPQAPAPQSTPPAPMPTESRESPWAAQVLMIPPTATMPSPVSKHPEPTSSINTAPMLGPAYNSTPEPTSVPYADLGTITAPEPTPTVAPTPDVSAESLLPAKVAPVATPVPVPTSTPLPTRVLDTAHLHIPVSPLMVSAHMEWGWNADQDSLREVVAEFTIHNDVGDWSGDFGYHLILLRNAISGTNFQFGLEAE